MARVQTRHLKFWHDYSDVSGHHFYLLLVSAVYDPLIYYTSDEMKAKGTNIDVPSVVEQPEIHILGRSESSLEEQSSFTDCRRDGLKEINIILETATGGQLHEVARFFHGDGPVQ